LNTLKKKKKLCVLCYLIYVTLNLIFFFLGAVASESAEEKKEGSVNRGTYC